MKRAARKDSNHNQVMNAFIKRGWTVLDTWQIKNAFDILITKNFQTIAVEIKDSAKCPSKRKLTEGEQKFKERWETHGFWRLCESLEDVEAIDREFSARSGL